MQYTPKHCLLQVAEDKATAMRSLQQEVDQLKEDREREKELAARRTREDEEELQILRDRCERLEANGGGVRCMTFTIHASNSINPFTLL